MEDRSNEQVRPGAGGIVVSMTGALLRGTKAPHLVTILLGCLLVVPGEAQPVQGSGESAPAVQKEPQKATVLRRERLNHLPPSARQYYALLWGVDSLSVKSTESGEIIRFTYRVVDVEKAKALNDKKNEPSLIDPRAGVRLVVPTMEKVGQLRQTGAPEEGKNYWMAFSNKGRPVKRGDHVIVVIGAFHADGLVVD